MLLASCGGKARDAARASPRTQQHPWAPKVNGAEGKKPLSGPGPAEGLPHQAHFSFRAPFSREVFLKSSPLFFECLKSVSIGSGARSVIGEVSLSSLQEGGMLGESFGNTT